uniref:Alpha-type protein kinase domain-containing protein n=1 Tax=Knipowitschia caucasica TaxID=637954 RepID=A0AAV2KPT1_KNICA
MDSQEVGLLLQQCLEEAQKQTETPGKPTEEQTQTSRSCRAAVCPELSSLLQEAQDMLWPFVPERWQYKEAVEEDDKSNLSSLIQQHLQPLLALLKASIVCSEPACALAVILLVDRFLYWTDESRRLLRITKLLHRLHPEVPVAPQLLIRQARVHLNSGKLQKAEYILSSLINNNGSTGCWEYQSESERALVQAVSLQVRGMVLQKLGLWLEAAELIWASLVGYYALPKPDKKGIGTSLGLLANILVSMNDEDFGAFKTNPDVDLSLLGESSHRLLSAARAAKMAVVYSQYTPLYVLTNAVSQGTSLLSYSFSIPCPSSLRRSYLLQAREAFEIGLLTKSSSETVTSVQELHTFRNMEEAPVDFSLEKFAKMILKFKKFHATSCEMERSCKSGKGEQAKFCITALGTTVGTLVCHRCLLKRLHIETKFQLKQRRVAYSGLLLKFSKSTGLWTGRETCVYIGDDMGLKGKQREALWLQFLHQEERLSSYVGKEYLSPRHLEVPLQDVERQMTAQFYVTHFNKSLYERDQMAQIFYIPSDALLMLEEDRIVGCVSVEPFMLGDFVKLTNNNRENRGETPGHGVRPGLRALHLSALRGTGGGGGPAGWVTANGKGLTYLTDPQNPLHQDPQGPLQPVRREGPERTSIEALLRKDQDIATPEPTEERARKRSLLRFHSDSESEDEDEEGPNGALTRYRAEPTIIETGCPLQWWSTHEGAHPQLSALARNYDTPHLQTCDGEITPGAKENRPIL